MLRSMRTGQSHRTAQVLARSSLDRSTLQGQRLAEVSTGTIASFTRLHERADCNCFTLRTLGWNRKSTSTEVPSTRPAKFPAESIRARPIVYKSMHKLQGCNQLCGAFPVPCSGDASPFSEVDRHVFRSMLMLTLVPTACSNMRAATLPPSPNSSAWTIA
jgi:hypothetical protein